MQFFILVILICLFVFLYCVYLLANDDFIFLRKDVTMERLFNTIFLGGLISLFVSRLFYGFHAKSILANPFVFLLFPYFPGLSLVGGVLGAGAAFLFMATRKKNTLPLGRMSDFFSIAFLVTLPVGFIGYFIFSEDGDVVRVGSLVITYLILFIIFLRFLLPSLLNGKLKEGTITLIFLICFSIISLASHAFPKISVLDYFKNFENLILMAVLIASLVFLVKQENLLLRIGELRRRK